MSTASVGDEASASLAVSAETIERYAALVGDDNPLHTDPSYAAETMLEVLDGLNASEAEAADRVGRVFRRVRNHAFHPVREGFTHDRELDEHGVADLQDSDGRVRLLAVRDLVRLGEAGAAAIREGLRDSDPHVRQIAAMALGILEHGPAVEPLRRLLREDGEPWVRSQAAVSLGRIGEERTLSLLEERAEEDPSRDVRHQCRLAAYRIDNGIGAETDIISAYAGLEESAFGRVEVDEPADNFALLDTGGNTWRLSDHLGERPVVLIWIFADWCPVCHNEFRELIELREAFEQHDVEVVTIEAHDRYRARVMTGQELVEPEYWFAEESPQEVYAERIWWPHLVDPAGAVGARYGVDPLQFAVHSEWINRPTTVIIDEEGVVRFLYRGTYWGDRPSIEKTLEMAVEGEYGFEHPDRLRPASEPRDPAGSEGR